MVTNKATVFCHFILGSVLVGGFTCGFGFFGFGIVVRGSLFILLF